jgi:hypothetical protein
MLGYKVSERSVSNLMPKRKGKPPSQTWRTFLRNHIPHLVSIDFFTVPTATFRILYVLVFIKHFRRKFIRFNATYNPTSCRTAQQIKEAFPWDTAPKYMMFAQYLRYAQNLILEISDICLRLNFSHALILDENSNFSRHP